MEEFPYKNINLEFQGNIKISINYNINEIDENLTNIQNLVNHKLEEEDLRILINSKIVSIFINEFQQFSTDIQKYILQFLYNVTKKGGLFSFLLIECDVFSKILKFYDDYFVEIMDIIANMFMDSNILIQQYAFINSNKILLPSPHENYIKKYIDILVFIFHFPQSQIFSYIYNYHQENLKIIFFPFPHLLLSQILLDENFEKFIPESIILRNFEDDENEYSMFLSYILLIKHADDKPCMEKINYIYENKEIYFRILENMENIFHEFEFNIKLAVIKVLCNINNEQIIRNVDLVDLLIAKYKIFEYLDLSNKIFLKILTIIKNINLHDYIEENNVKDEWRDFRDFCESSENKIALTIVEILDSLDIFDT